MDSYQQLIEAFALTQGPSVNIRVELDPEVAASVLPIEHAPAAGLLNTAIVGNRQSYGVLLPDFNYHCGDFELVWQLEVLGASVLHFCEFSISTGASHTVSIELPAPAVPQVAFSASGDQVFANVVLRNGIVLTFPYTRPSITSHKASGLKTLRPNSIIQCSLSEYRSALESPTALALAESYLCIAGKGSSILCVPLEYCKNVDTGNKPFELRGNSWGFKPMLQGVLYKTEHTGVLGLFSLKFGLTSEQEVLGSVHQNGRIHLWDLSKRIQIPLDFPHDTQHNAKQDPPNALTTHWIQPSRTDSICFVQFHARQVGLHTKCYKVSWESGKFTAAAIPPPPNQHLPLLGATLVRKRQSYQVWTLTASAGAADGGLSGVEGDVHEVQVVGFSSAGGTQIGEAVLAEHWLQRWLPSSGNSIDQEFQTMFCGENACTNQQCFLPLLLAPGILSRTALCDALSLFGARLTPGEVHTATLTYLHSCVEATLMSIAQHNPGMSLDQAWSTLSSTYLQCWRQRHAVLRIVALTDGSLLVLRAGLHVSVLRPASAAESSVLISPTAPSGQEDILRLLQQLLGSYLLGLSTAQLLTGTNARVQLVPLLVHMVLTGPVPALSQPHSDAAAQDQREWRKLRRQLILMLNSNAEAVANLVRSGAEALMGGANAIEDAPMSLSSNPIALEGVTKLPPSPLTSALASSGAALIGWAQSAAALQLLVLAGLLDELKLLPPAQNTSHSESLGMLTHKVQSATLTLWLCTHPATPGTSKEDAADALEVLSRLRLSPVSPARPAARAVSTIPLASSLLPLMCKQAPNLREALTQFLEAPAALVTYIQHGLSGQYADTSVSEFLKAGYLLFQAREVNCLEQLVKLAGESAQRSAALLFLQGLGLACQVRQASTSDRPQILTQATTLFFRAASSFRSNEGGDLHEMLSDLRQELVAGGEEDVGDVEAVLQLQLYEAVMHLFEREGAPDGAILFAQAAIEQLPAAYGDPISEVGRKLAGRLWSHVFSCACDLQDYDGAYVAVLSNPITRDSVECLRRLVHCCCDDGHYLQLCSLPFAGTATVENRGGDGKKKQVSFMQEAVGTLQKRARHADITTEPSPYFVLYSFLTSRSCHRQAAAVMLEYAERLTHEDAGPSCVQKMMTAYGCVIGSLELVEPASAWLQSSVQSPSRAGDGPDKPMPVLLLDDLRKEFARLSAASTVMLSAASTLAESAKDRTADDLFQQLLALHLYDAALALAHSTWHDATLAGMIQRVVCALATLCVRSPDLQEEDNMFPEGTDGDVAMYSRGEKLDAGPSGRHTGGAPKSAAAWASLKKMVQVYYADQDQRNALGLHSLGIAVADALLAADRRMSLPPWLLDILQAADSRQGMAGPAADSSSLLITFLKHDRLLEATDLVLSHLSTLSTLDPRAREQHCATWLPHNIISVLHKRLEVQVEKMRRSTSSRTLDAAEYDYALKQLDDALKQHMELAEQHTNRLFAYGKAVVV